MRILLLLLGVVWGTSHAEQLSFIYYREQGRAVFESIMEQFSQQYHHQVSFHQITSETLKPALVKSVMRGTAADVVFAPSDIIGIAEQAKFSEVPINLVDPNTPKELLHTALNKQKLYGIPILQGNHLMLFYNRRYVSSPAKTWQDLLAQKAEFDQQGIATIGWNYTEMYWFAGFYNTFGGRMTRGQEVTLNEPAMQDALNFYKSLSNRGLVSAACTYDCGYRDFIEGKVAYSINGEWSIADFERRLGDDLGIAVIPKIGLRTFKTLSSSLVLVFPNNSLSSDKAKALNQLIEYLQSEAVQQRLYHEARFLPVNDPLLKQIHSHASANEAAMLAQLADAVPMSAEGAQSSAWLGMRKGFELFNKGLVDAARASRYMQTYAERDYKQSQQ